MQQWFLMLIEGWPSSFNHLCTVSVFVCETFDPWELFEDIIDDEVHRNCLLRFHLLVEALFYVAILILFHFSLALILFHIRLLSKLVSDFPVHKVGIFLVTTRQFLFNLCLNILLVLLHNLLVVWHEESQNLCPVQGLSITFHTPSGHFLSNEPC